MSLFFVFTVKERERKREKGFFTVKERERKREKGQKKTEPVRARCVALFFLKTRATHEWTTP